MRDHVTVEKMAEVPCFAHITMLGYSPCLQQLARQAEKFPRYRQILENVGQLFRGPSFVDDPDFNVLNHIHVRRLPEPAGKRELDALVRASDHSSRLQATKRSHVS